MVVTFGYCVEAPVEWAELLELALELDRNSRFDVLMISDALVANGPLDEPRLDAWTALAALAQATERLRIGVLVSGNPYRHPSVLAKVATTVDHVSGGRLEFGIGAGWPGESRRFGVDFGTRQQRYERLEEALAVITLLWSRPYPSFEGRYCRLDAPPYAPANVQRPHPPITVGLAGATRPEMLRIAARYADKVEAPIEAFPLVAAQCRELGRDPATVAFTTETQMFLHDDAAVQQRALAYAMETYGRTEDAVRRESLFGGIEEVREGARARIAAGYTEVYVFQLPRVHLKSVMRFSEEVIPAFR